MRQFHNKKWYIKICRNIVLNAVAIICTIYIMASISAGHLLVINDFWNIFWQKYLIIFIPIFIISIISIISRE